jgi:hypothetical protein
MSCNHLSDCPRCGDVVEALEAELERLTMPLAEVREMVDIVTGNTLGTLDEKSYTRLESLAFWVGHCDCVLNPPSAKETA